MSGQSDAGAQFETSVIAKPTSPTTSQFSSKPCATENNTSSPSPVLGASSPQPASLPSSPVQVQEQLSSALTLNNLPEEILVDIFFLLIYHTSLGCPLERALDRTIRSSYKQLFILMNVCSEWRRICLSRGAFWSLVSACKRWKEPESILNLCLERSRDSNLHLDGELDDAPHDKILDILTEHGPRIRTLSIHGENPEPLRNTVQSLLAHTKPGCVPNLFVRNYQMVTDSDSHHTWPCLFPFDSPEHTQLNALTDSLSALRLCGFRLDWSHTGFSQLVELKIQRICFHTLPDISDLLHAVASAPKLSRLQLIDLRCHLDDVNTLQIDQPEHLPVSHPSLQFLFLKNLRWSLLMLLLRSIIPGAYKIAISYSWQREYLIRYTSDLNVLKESVLQNSNIDTLMLSRNWIQRSDILRSLLKAMPTVKGLSIVHCEFKKKTYQALVRPSDESEGDFPTISRLHVMGSTFELEDLEGLKEVVTSHGIQELKLGGSIDDLKPDPGHSPTLDHSVRYEDSNDDEHTAPIKDWLQENVPKFDLVNKLDDLPDYDFQSYEM